MKRVVTSVLFVLSFFAGFAQSSNDLADLVARACQTDSVHKTLGVYNEDSVLVFYLQTPDYDEYGATSYDFEKFELVFDVSTNLLFAQQPFGKLDFVEFGKKKCRMVIELAGAGDREKNKQWTYAVYEYSRSKGGPWLLQGVNYYFEDYYKGKKID